MDKIIPIPRKVAANATKGLDLRFFYNRGGTEVGIKTAKTLESKSHLTIGQVKKIGNYFPRHQNDNLNPGSNGTIAWLLWGGTDAWIWADKVIEKYEKKHGKVKMETVT